MTEALETTWTVPLDHPAFAGHFPARPILPGVVLLDYAVAAAQHCFPGLCCTHIEQGKFLLPVSPGTVLQLRLQQRAARSPTEGNGLAGQPLQLDFDIRRTSDDARVASGRLQLQQP